MSDPLESIRRIIEQTKCKDGSYISTIELTLDVDDHWIESLLITRDGETVIKFEYEDQAMLHHNRFVEEHGGCL